MTPSPLPPKWLPCVQRISRRQPWPRTEVMSSVQMRRPGYKRWSGPPRAAFLSDASHRIRVLYTPKHSSWLNQIELWFSILVRRLLKRGNFTSVADLRERILAFIAYFNKTMAKPFKWTYKGRPLTV